MAQFFVDTGDGVEYYDTAEEAKRAAENWIDEYRTLPEWDEAVERVGWGQIRESAWPRCYEKDGGEYVDYSLKEPK